MKFDVYDEIMLMREDAAKRNAQAAIKERVNNQKVISEEVEYNAIWNKLASLDEQSIDIMDYRKQVTDAFLVEGLTIFVDNCVNPAIIKEECNQKLVRQLVSAFVNEEGSTKLLNKMKRTSQLMSEIAYIVEQTVETVLESADKNNTETFKLDDKTKNEFYKKLSGVDAEAALGTITERVAKETKEFVEDNIKEKSRIQTAAAKTEAQVAESKARLEEKQGNSPKAAEKEQKIQEGYISLGKDRIMEIRESRNKTVFECMVYNLSKSAMLNESANKAFVEDARLNMDKIVEHCEVMYTFLMAMDSTKLINVDEAYIQSMLNDLKG